MSPETYNTLKLNGKIYSRQELLDLSEAKLIDTGLPAWEKAIYLFIAEWLNDSLIVEVKTSGSTGKPQIVFLEKSRMIASAKATNSFFNLNKNKRALLCLSANYIAGKMMLVRAFVGSFDLHCVEPKSNALLYNQSNFDFAAVVPMQLESVLKEDKQLNRIQKLIVGGAALRSDLAANLDCLKTEVWSTYGMTETITHVALQALNGKFKTDYFQALQGVSFQIDERNCLRIIAPAISAKPITTNDRVQLLTDKQFRFLGRVDFVINSGGIKFSPEILEQKIASHIAGDFAFSSRLDDALGEKLILVIEGESYTEEKRRELDENLKSVLDRFEQPKEILFVPKLPKTLNGKLDRISLKKMIS